MMSLPRASLDIDGRFGREHVRVAVEVRVEHDAVFGDLAQTGRG